MIIDLDARRGEIIWRPDASVAESSSVTAFASNLVAAGRIDDDSYETLWRWSIEKPDEFWPELIAFAGLELGNDVGPVISADPMPATRWFAGRTLNAARRFLDGFEGVALVRLSEDGERREVTWAELRDTVGALAAQLTAWGVGKGDRVVAILNNVEETVAAFLAVASVGAIWSVCAPEFGAGAIVSRFAQLEPKVLVAAPGYRLAGRDRDRSHELGEIISELPTLEHIVWVRNHTDAPLPNPVAVPSTDWSDAVARPAPLVYTDVEFSHPLWVLFSSGTTGKPKGIVHGHGGALVETIKLHLFHSDLRPGDRYVNVASTSWVLWNSLVGALTVGATAVLIDGSPTFPEFDRVWRIVAEEDVAVIGLGAGFIHACLKEDQNPAGRHDFSALRAIQVTGSPLSPEGQRWIYRAIGDVWVNSMSGGTDIASIFVGGVVTLPVRVGYIQSAALGVDVDAWDEAGESVRSERGELVIRQSMPSMPLSFWGDSDGSRYHAAYFDTYPGIWRHGDFIEISELGIVIHGRSDSTLNRNGLRLGSAEIYSAVEAVPGVREAMVVGVELGTDYYMPLFLALTPDADEAAVRAAVDAAIRRALSARYLPDEMVVVRGIPHTRTGKKLEVPIKRLLQGADFADVADPGSVDDATLLDDYARFARQRSEAPQKRTTT